MGKEGLNGAADAHHRATPEAAVATVGARRPSPAVSVVAAADALGRARQRRRGGAGHIPGEHLTSAAATTAVAATPATKCGE